MHSFFINIGNAVDMSFFKMFFYEKETKGRLSILEVDCIENLSDEILNLRKMIQRESIDLAGSEIILCVPKDWAHIGFEECSDLYVRLCVYSALKEFIRKKILSVQIISLKRVTDNPETAFERENSFLWEHGYTRNIQVKTFPEKVRLESNQLEQCEMGSLLYDEIFASNMETQFLKWQENKTDGSLIEFYEESFKRFKADCLENPAIETYELEVDVQNRKTYTKRMLKFVSYLTREHSQEDHRPLDRRFQEFCNSFEEKSLAQKILRYQKKLQESKRTLDQMQQSSEVHLEAVRRDVVTTIGDETSKKWQFDIDTFIEDVLNLPEEQEWDEEYILILKKLDYFDSKLQSYGEAVKKEFHQPISPMIEKQTAYDYANLEQAEHDLDMKSEEAAENMHNVGIHNNESYRAKLEIVNKICAMKIKIKKMKENYQHISMKEFLKVWGACMMAVCVPYSISQMYIFSGLFKGNYFPVVCLMIFAVSFFSAKLILTAIVKYSLSKAYDDLRDEVENYVQNLESRKQDFTNCVNGMIELENIERARLALDLEKRSRQEFREQKEFHKKEISDHLNATNYFKELMTLESNYALGVRSEYTYGRPLDLGKSVKANEIYWMER